MYGILLATQKDKLISSCLMMMFPKMFDIFKPLLILTNLGFLQPFPVLYGLLFFLGYHLHGKIWAYNALS